MFDVSQTRKDFPLLSRKVYDKPLVYLDSAASAQKPKYVMDAMQDFMQHDYANVHRGLHYLSNTATDAFEAARSTVQEFINAAHMHEIIFTSGATDAINLVADSFLAPQIEAGDEIILTQLEHHANIIPWHFLRERLGAVLKWVPVDETGQLNQEAYKAAFSPRTKMVALTHMSNVLGIIPPVEQMIAYAHDKNVPVLLDGCQAIVHQKLDVEALDCDFYVFSGHKIYGPTGIGVLYGKAEYLEAMRPYRGGGEMIRTVSEDQVSYGDIPHRFEAGTPPIIEAIGLKAAIDYIHTLDRDQCAAHEAALLTQATQSMGEMNGVTIFGNVAEKAAILSFGVENVHPHDIAMIMDREAVALRAGHHCAQPLMTALNIPATLRASFAFYNSAEEVDIFLHALKKAMLFFMQR